MLADRSLRLPRALATLAVSGLVVAGCASGSGSAPAATSGTTTTATTTATTTTTTTTTTATTAATTTSTTTLATTTTVAITASVGPLPPDVRARMTGRSWRPGCPVGLDELALVLVPYVDLDGTTRQGELVVHQDQAAAVGDVFVALYRAGFPIERMQLVDDFGADDDASMAANNTSAFNCRPIAGTDRWSEHSYGRAVDVNPRFNPWVRGSQIDPPNGTDYADRTRQRPGMIQPGDIVVQAFARAGWSWGGDRQQAKDYQHFSATGR